MNAILTFLEALSICILLPLAILYGEIRLVRYLALPRWTSTLIDLLYGASYIWLLLSYNRLTELRERQAALWDTSSDTSSFRSPSADQTRQSGLERREAAASNNQPYEPETNYLKRRYEELGSPPLTLWGIEAEEHWRKNLPMYYESLKENGLLLAAVVVAQENAKDRYTQLIDEGTHPEAALELAKKEFLLLDAETESEHPSSARFG